MIKFSSGAILRVPAIQIIAFQIVVLTTIAGCALAQSRTDSITAIALRSAIDLYDKELGRNTMIFTGEGYYDPYQGIKGHQFFLDDYWEVGSVLYDGHHYDSVNLKYDILKDLIIVENYNSKGYSSPNILYGPKVSSFNLVGHQFVRLEKDPLSGLKEGYYETIYHKENIEIYIKRRKEIVNTSIERGIREKFEQKDRYYIFKDGKYNQVRRKKSIVKLFEDRKKEIKSFLNANNYDFKINPDLQYIEVVDFYISLL